MHFIILHTPKIRCIMIFSKVYKSGAYYPLPLRPVWGYFIFSLFLSINFFGFSTFIFPLLSGYSPRSIHQPAYTLYTIIFKSLLSQTPLCGHLIITERLLCPWGKKALTLPLNSTHLIWTLINMDTSYGPLSVCI